MSNEDMTQLGNALMELQSRHNNGRGISCMRAVAHYLLKGQWEDAKNTAENEFGKVHRFEEIVNFLHANHLRTPTIWG